MKKRHWLIPGAIALGMSCAAVAANLSNGFGATCNGMGTWHFVNNQTNGATGGTLHSYFSGGLYVNAPSKVTKGTVHFVMTAPGTLETASTDLPGRLVLSSFSCVPTCSISSTQSTSGLVTTTSTARHSGRLPTSTPTRGSSSSSSSSISEPDGVSVHPSHFPLLGSCSGSEPFERPLNTEQHRT